MNFTKHIDFTGGDAPEAYPVLFPSQNLVISFVTLDAAMSSLKESAFAGVAALPLFAPEEKGAANGS